MVPLVQLGDLVRIEKGKKASQVFERPSANTLRYLQIDDLRPDAKRKFVEPFSCPIASKTDVVIAWDGANAGTVSCNLDGYIGSTLAVLRPSTQQLFAPYLSRFLEGKFDYLQKNSTGATVPHVSRDVLDSLELPLPNLIEQRRIAAQLEQADRLRRTRRYALELSDSFLPAAFLELFGDPASNPMQWKSCCLGDVLLSAQDGPHVSLDYCDQGIPFLSTRNVRPGELVWEDVKHISREDAQEQWRKVKPEKGDLLYTKGGTTGMAKVVDFDREFAVWVHIAVLKLRKELVVPLWLENMLNSRFCYQQSQALTLGIVNRDLGLKRMPGICIYLPPLPLQQKFAALVERHEHLRATQREALRQAEHLFQTLLHRAFSAGG